MSRLPIWPPRILRRLRALIQPGAVDREMDEEIRLHIELETEELMRSEGLPREEARRRALVAFGGVERYREAHRNVRGVRRIENRVQDLRYAIRSLRKTPGFTAAVILVLALGIGANAAMFSLVDRLFIREPGGVVDPASVREVTVYWLGPKGHSAELPSLSSEGLDVVRKALGNMGSVAARAWFNEGIDRATGPRVYEASANYFSLLGVVPARGRFFSARETASSAPLAVVSYGYWQRALAGDPGVLGRTIEVGARHCTVIGVAPRDFSGLNIEATDVWLPLPPDARGGAVIRLAPGTSPHVVETILTAAVRRSLFSHARKGAEPSVMAKSLVFAEDGPLPLQPNVIVSERVAGVAALILLIALANMATLLLMRAARRRREVAVRLVLGVSRARLASQLLTEGALLTSVAGMGALGLGVWGGALVRAYFMPRYRLSYPILDTRLVLFTVAVAVGGGLLASLAPAIQASTPDLTEWLKTGTHETGHQRSRLRSGLVVLQAALSVVLVVGAGLFVRSLRNIHAVPLGVRVAGLTVARAGFRHGDATRAYLSAFQDEARRMAGLPGVQGAAVSVFPPLEGLIGVLMFRQDGDTLRVDGHLGVNGNAVGPGYFTVARMRLIDGRGFTPADGATSRPVLVVSASMARAVWPGEHAVGKCLSLWKASAPCAVVVGVVTDANLWSIKPEYHVAFYQPITQTRIAFDLSLTVRASPGAAATLVHTVRTDLTPRLPSTATLDVQRLSDALAPQYRQWQLGAVVFSAMGLLALLVAGLGMYSVIGYSVAQRTHELGVRAALGAGRGRMTRLVILQALGLAVIGIVLGVGAALVLGHLVASLLFETSPHDPTAMVVAALVLAVTATGAALLPAWRAGRVDPAVTLRAE